MIHVGDCLEVMQGLADNSIDSIVTDPPYGISFMAKRWDYDVPSVEIWRECMRVLKPGGHMLVACGTRTQHRMVVNIEDAGFEIRDVVTWLYGQGFPKSLNIGKAIDKELGAQGAKGPMKRGGERLASLVDGKRDGKEKWGDESGRSAFIYIPSTDAAKQWDGWGTALKPSAEFWTLARKPLSEPTIAKNVLKWGTGGINVDGCRISTGGKVAWKVPHSDKQSDSLMVFKNKPGVGSDSMFKNKGGREGSAQGRFPSNLILDEHAAAMLDEQSGNTVSRFFYQAKSSKADRGQGNTHPTCKPTTLMAYLCRLITPPGGTVLDPFAGSGSTGVAAIREGFAFVGIEREAEYAEIAKARINAAS